MRSVPAYLAMRLLSMVGVVLAGCTQEQLQGWLPGDPDTTNHTSRIIGLLVTSWIVRLAVGRFEYKINFSGKASASLKANIVNKLAGELGVSGGIDHGGSVLRLSAEQLLVGPDATRSKAKIEPALG